MHCLKHLVVSLVMVPCFFKRQKIKIKFVLFRPSLRQSFTPESPARVTSYFQRLISETENVRGLHLTFVSLIPDPERSDRDEKCRAVDLSLKHFIESHKQYDF